MCSFCQTLPAGSVCPVCSAAPLTWAQVKAQRDASKGKKRAPARVSARVATAPTPKPAPIVAPPVVTQPFAPVPNITEPGTDATARELLDAVHAWGAYRDTPGLASDRVSFAQAKVRGLIERAEKALIPTPVAVPAPLPPVETVGMFGAVDKAHALTLARDLRRSGQVTASLAVLVDVAPLEDSVRILQALARVDTEGQRNGRLSAQAHETRRQVWRILCRVMPEAHEFDPDVRVINPTLKLVPPAPEQNPASQPQSASDLLSELLNNWTPKAQG